MTCRKLPVFNGSFRSFTFANKRKRTDACGVDSEEPTMHGMMDGMMGGGMMWGMGFFWLLILVVLVLAAAALIKYLFFDGRRD